jgi:hypothetical protein
MDSDDKKMVGLGCLILAGLLAVGACIGILGPIFGWFGKKVIVNFEEAK